MAAGATQAKPSWLCFCLSKPAAVNEEATLGEQPCSPCNTPHSRSGGTDKARATLEGSANVLARAGGSASDLRPAGSRDQTAAAGGGGLRPIKTQAAAEPQGSSTMGTGDAARGGSADQGAAAAAVQSPTMADLKHLMASSFSRPYTDADWFAALRALEAVTAQQRQRALQALRITSSGPTNLHRSSFTSAASGPEQWHDAVSHTMSDASAVSEAERHEVAQLAAELELLRGPVAVSVVRELDPNPACVPNPPLLFAEPHWKYRQVDCSAFIAYWERDPDRSTPFPLPIDHQLKLNVLQRRTHESIPGMRMHMVSPTQMQLTATPSFMAIPGAVSYCEFFNTDSSPAHWTLRRDIRLGRTEGQMFMTTDGILIFRVFSSGVFSRTVEWTGEDYMRLEDNGNTIITRQLCKNIEDNTVVGGQFLVGRRRLESTSFSRRHSFGGGH